MATDSPPTAQPPDERQLRELVAPLINTRPEDIPGGANLIMLGLSSLDLMRLVGRWRRERVPVVFEELAATPTLDGWLAHLDGLRT
ncbi:phosphopantetheine-binding protein [Umezawaea beigongshangensis]|uniref:phosphopantetheine-binding protein n=1 Tax=Umezawaea beigongshangensis TaxID=2780383 RepID=UPI0018F21070|nr:phosphopantetheine-binding protein [Umezawaea beigongshangensis]